MADFSELQDDFTRITTETVFCMATTVDERGRPRSRMLHPIFVVDGGRPLGWAVTGPTPLKAKHLAGNPHLACSYWNPSQDTMFIDCTTSWIADEAEKRRVWDLFIGTPLPLGWGPEGMAGFGEEQWANPIFTALRLEPWRVQVMRGEEYTVGKLTGAVWRSESKGE